MHQMMMDRIMTIDVSTLAKIADNQLRNFAKSSSLEEAEVILHLNLPIPRASFTKGLGPIRKSGSVRPNRVQSLTKTQKARIGKIMTRAAKMLEELTGTPPVKLASANSFSTVLNGQQLREVAEWPFVKSVGLNRHLSY